MLKIFIAIACFVAFTQAQEFCHRCSSSDNNFDCVFPDRLANFTTQCNLTSGFCFTRINANGHIQRGCGSELEATECEGELCNRCALIASSVTPCNDHLVPVDRLTCYTCVGDRNSTCGTINSSSLLHRSICPTFLNDNQCVATRSGEVIHRGCLSDMPNVNCNVTHNCCLGHGCNHWTFEEIPNSAISIHSFLKVAFVAFIGAAIGYRSL